MTTTLSSAAPGLRRPLAVDPAMVIFTATSFLSAFLLFLVQPMIGKMLLPRFGGVPAVWNTCQLFFQAVLLAGYGYAHLSAARLGVRRQLFVHLVVLALPVLSLPIAFPAWWAPSGGDAPIPLLLGTLAVAVGLPFFAVSVTAPLLQRWYADTGRPGSADPYFLYAASNLGSLAALLGYPAAIEPNLTLRAQGQFWAGGFGLLAVLILVCGAFLWWSPRAAAGGEDRAPAGQPPVRLSWRTRLHWVALAFVPSGLLLGVTTHITTDVAPVPFLWVLPLALYLLAFVLVFARLPQAVGRAMNWVMPASLVLLLAGVARQWAELGLHLLFFFAASMVLLGELVRRRPPVGGLTEFYLWMSVGGVLGGVVNAVLAPALLTGFYEYRAEMVLACLLMPSPWPVPGSRLGRADLALPVVLGVAAGVTYFQTGSDSLRWVFALGCAALVRWPVRFGLGAAGLLIAAGIFSGSRVEVVYQARNFFGVLRVTRDPDLPVYRLVHGTTEHGMQHRHEIRSVRRLPRAYFDPTGPIGQVFMSDKSGAFPPVAVIGLGAGSLATYAGDGQEFVFFEIDPNVVRVARDKQYFTFLDESRGAIRVVLGDARLTLAAEPAGHYGLLVVDAFSSDAIPIHLLTTEAFDVYLDKLAPDGMIAFHISNNYLDLERVLDGIARTHGLHGLSRKDTRDNLTKDELKRGKKPSHWVLLARNPAAFRWVAPDPQWKPLPGRPDAPVWTDDFANPLGVLRFR